MQKILRGLAIFTVIAAGTTLHARPALADIGIIKGCWFTPPNPPACDICADSCNPGQNCCIILHT